MLTDNLAGVDEVVNDSLMHSGEGEGVGADTVELVSALVVLAEDGSLGNEHNRATLELLLELAGQTDLDSSESLEQLVGDEDDDGLLVSSDLDLLSSGHLEGLKRLSQILGLLGDLSDLVSNGNLEIGGLDSFGLHDHLHGLEQRLAQSSEI